MARLIHYLVEQCFHCGAVEVLCGADVDDDPERYSDDINKVTCPRCNHDVRRRKRTRAALNRGKSDIHSNTKNPTES